MTYSLEELKKKNNILKKTQERGIMTKVQSTLVSSANNSLSALRSQLSLEKTEVSGKSIEERVKKLSSQILPETSKILKESKVNIICIFDKSGSCQGTESATIAGYKELIEKEKRTGFPAEVTTILFDNTARIINNQVNINEVPELSYYADGGTALYDTLVMELGRIKNEKTLKGEEREKTIVAIMTDGKDEHSRKYNERDVRQIITECKNLGWEFIFLGAKQNAYQVATSLGIEAQNAEIFQATAQGFYLNFKAIESAIESYRLKGKIAPDWSKIVRENNALSLESGKRNDGPTLSLGSGRK